jgi:FkbM family methyltransferase
MKQMLKLFAQERLPQTARTYRYIRDYFWYWGLKTHETTLGLQLVSEPGLPSAIPTCNELHILRRYSTCSDLFVDIGAHLGLYSCALSNWGLQVMAVEPHPLNVKLLLRNIRLNQLSNIEVYPLALSGQIGVMPLYGGQQGGSFRSDWAGNRANYETLVPTVTLDRLVSGVPERCRLLIKMDVEGHELSVLSGAATCLARNPRPIWTVEIGLTENFGGNVNPHYREVFEAFWAHNYVASPLNQMDRVLEPEDIGAWLSSGRTDHGDINYLFRERKVTG